MYGYVRCVFFFFAYVLWNLPIIQRDLCDKYELNYCGITRVVANLNINTAIISMFTQIHIHTHYISTLRTLGHDVLHFAFLSSGTSNNVMQWEREWSRPVTQVKEFLSTRILTLINLRAMWPNWLVTEITPRLWLLSCEAYTEKHLYYIYSNFYLPRSPRCCTNEIPGIIRTYVRTKSTRNGRRKIWHIQHISMHCQRTPKYTLASLSHFIHCYKNIQNLLQKLRKGVFRSVIRINSDMMICFVNFTCDYCLHKSYLSR